MNFRIVIIIVMVTLAAGPILISGQLSGPYTSSCWSIEDGLSNNEVTTVKQSPNGIVWIGTTHGLNQFDGVDFKIHRHDPQDEETLKANYINEITFDSTGRLWVFFAVGGVSFLNTESGKFNNLKFDSYGNQVEEPVVYTLESIDDHLYLGTSLGVAKIDLNRKSFHLLNNPDSVSFKAKFIKAFPSEIIAGGENGLFLLNSDNHKIQEIKLAWKDSLYTYQYPISSISTYSENNVPVITSSVGGVFYYDQKHKFLIPLWHQVDSTLSSHQMVQSVYNLDDTLWVDIKDHGTFFWKHFPDQLKFKSGIKNKSPVHSIIQNKSFQWKIHLNSATCRSLENPNSRSTTSLESSLYLLERSYVDKEGFLWLPRRSGGLCRIHPQNNVLKRWPSSIQNEALPPQDVFAIHCRSEREVLFSLETGIHSLNLTSNTQRLIHPLNGYRVNAIVPVGDQLYLGTNRGLLILKSGEKKIIKGKEAGGPLNNSYVWTVLADSKKRIWIGTISGLHYLDPTTEKIVTIPQDRVRDIRSIIEISNDAMLIGSSRYGLSKLYFESSSKSWKTKTYDIQEILPHTGASWTINDFYRENDQVWIGTYSNGILKYDIKKDDITIPFRDLPIIPNVAAITGSENYLWVSSDDGIFQVSKSPTADKRFKNDFQNLQSRQYNFGVSDTSPEGTIFFGGIQGFNYFHPDSIPTYNYIHPVIITCITIGGGQKPTKHFLGDSSATISYKNQNFAIEFVSPQFTVPNRLKYFYQLSGNKEEWIDNGHSRKIRFDQMAPGEYSLNIKATSGDGTAESSPKMIWFTVLPPFYQTSWFRTLIIFLLAGIGFGIHRFILHLKEERIKKIDQIRANAAADFHDELGHRLTKISLYTESLKEDYPVRDPRMSNLLQKLHETSTELYHSLRDFVWAMNPQKESLFELLIYLKDFGEDLFSNSGISFINEGFDPALTELQLNMEWKRNILLIFKEAMHNVLKHSLATEVKFKVDHVDSCFTMYLQDNGKGFTPSTRYAGYGLNNMRKRAKHLNGILDIKSTNNGTQVSLSFTLK